MVEHAEIVQHKKRVARMSDYMFSIDANHYDFSVIVTNFGPRLRCYGQQSTCYGFPIIAGPKPFPIIRMYFSRAVVGLSSFPFSSYLQIKVYILDSSCLFSSLCSLISACTLLKVSFFSFSIMEILFVSIHDLCVTTYHVK
jgi:hypothetical protein